MHTRSEIVNFITNRLGLLDGTSTDLTYLTQGGCAGELIKTRACYAMYINGKPDRVAKFDAIKANLNIDFFTEIDDLLTLAENAGSEQTRTDILKAILGYTQIIQAIILHIVGGDW